MSEQADGAAHGRELRVCLLGRFEVRVGGAVVIDRSWSRGKAKALLKLLALAGGRPLQRDQLLELLWPDLEPSAGAANLRKTLHHIRSAVAARGVTLPVVSAVGDAFALADAAAVDVDEFRARARSARTMGDDCASYEAALSLYAGDLLPEDLYEEWAVAPREELRALRHDLLAELAAIHEAADERGAAIARLRELLETDPVDEQAHRTLIRLYAEAGSRHRALLQYERCRDVLNRELGVPPASETAALHAAILGEGLRPRQSSRGVAPPRPRADGRDSLPPMYGRERELELAGELLEAAADGRGGTLFVAGAAGIGKSRFVHEVLAATSDAGGLALSGRSYALEASVAYQPLREVLRQLADQAADGPALEVIRGSTHLRRLLGEVPLESSRGVDTDLLRSELFEDVAKLFRMLAAEGPVTVCCEDVHCADEGSLRLLHLLARRLAREPVVILATYRREEVGTGSPVVELVASLSGERVARTVTLEPLPAGLMELVVGEALDGQPADAGLVRELTRLAEGNPLFAHELVHTLRDEGWARLVDGRWERRGPDPPPLPMVVTEMVGRRLRRLAEPARGVLAAASVLGREFDYGLLRRTVALEERAVLDALDDAIGAFLVGETPKGYRFRHELVREAIYRGLTRARRQQLHREIATVLAADTGSAELDAERIGYHFASSDEAWRAVPYLRVAARKAAAVFASEQAVALHEQALAIGSWEWDIPGNEVRWSDELYRMHGLDRETFAASYEGFLERVHAADRDLVDSSVRAALAERSSFQFEHRIVRPDGEVRAHEARGRVICDPAGEPIKMAGTGLDLTARRLANERFLALLEAGPDAIVIVDDRGAIVLANSHADRLLGYEPGELIGEQVETVLRQRLWDPATYGHEPQPRDIGATGHTRARRKDGSELPVEISVSPLPTQEGVLLSTAIRPTRRRECEAPLEQHA